MMSEIAEFRWSKVGAYLEIAIETIGACGLLFLVGYVITDVSGFVLWFGAFSVLVAGLVLLCRVFVRLKYRYIFDVRYVAGRDGILMEAEGARKTFKWSEVAQAEYLLVVATYRLWIEGQTWPIVLMAIGGLPGGKLDHRNSVASRLLKGALGNRLKNRWLPW